LFFAFLDKALEVSFKSDIETSKTESYTCTKGKEFSSGASSVTLTEIRFESGPEGAEFGKGATCGAAGISVAVTLLLGVVLTAAMPIFS